MAKLITDHDPFHIHKILGVFALVHFVYRFLYAGVIRGYVFCSVKHVSNGFCSPEQVHYDAACIFLHALLSWSSLLLPLPSKRNFASPMIWPEFRLHSIAFATRGVIGSLIALYGLWPQHYALNFVCKLALVLATCYSADWITAKYGCTEKRTTNSMPYPECITPEMQKNIKRDYAKKQFAATLACVAEDPALAWASLLAIQGAPLLMTLVRKGKCSALTVHRVYILQLCLPMYIFMAGNSLNWNSYDSSLVHENSFRITQIVLVHHLVTTELRITYRCSKFVTWFVSIACFMAWMKIPILVESISWFYTNRIGMAILASRHVLVGQDLHRHYVPVFTLADKAPEAWDDFDDYILALVNHFRKNTYHVSAGTATTKKAT